MYRYEVAENKLLTPTVRQLTLACPTESEPLLHQPGQYATISLRDSMRPTTIRCFSIASSPTDQRTLQFSMRVKGRYTSALKRLQPGDSIAVRGPYGGFVFNQYLHTDLVMFAGGIGIAPFISMTRYATDLKLENRLHLIYSCRNQDDIAFFEVLKKLEHANPNLTVTYVIGAGETNKLIGLNTMVGMVDDQMIKKLGLNFKTQTFMTCGPPPYMKSIIGMLIHQGVPKNRILSEAFSQSSSHQTGKLISWPLNMY